MSSSRSSSVLPAQVKALAFDVFGTVVDWRSSVIDTLTLFAVLKLKELAEEDITPEETQARDVLRRLRRDDWARFAQQWRDSYKAFTAAFIPGTTPWKDIDAHHLDSLTALLAEWGLAAAFPDPDEVRHISRVWHRLRPWPDSVAGLRRLGRRFVTATLSNGNMSLLEDLDTFGGLGFSTILSAEDFGAYKPSIEVYRGAVRKLGLADPGEVALVAAHLGDLAGARRAGLRTIYVERPQEEDWRKDEERYQQAKEWVDVWVSEGDDGFVELAERLGLT